MEILTQAEQWPDRVAVNKSAWGKQKTEPTPKEPKAPSPPVGADVKRLKGKDTGLYGEDEDDTYDVYAQPSPDGKGWDVIRPVSR